MDLVFDLHGHEIYQQNAELLGEGVDTTWTEGLPSKPVLQQVVDTTRCTLGAISKVFDYTPSWLTSSINHAQTFRVLKVKVDPKKMAEHLDNATNGVDDKLAAISLAKLANLVINPAANAFYATSGVLQELGYEALQLPAGALPVFALNAAASGAYALTAYHQAANINPDDLDTLQTYTHTNPAWLKLAIGDEGITILKDEKGGKSKRLKAHIAKVQEGRKVSMVAAAGSLAKIGMVVAFPGAVAIPAAITLGTAFLELVHTVRG